MALKRRDVAGVEESSVISVPGTHDHSEPKFLNAVKQVNEALIMRVQDCGGIF